MSSASAYSVVLEGVNESVFGLVSGLLSALGQTCLLFALGLVYGMIVNWHLANSASASGRQLPIAALGHVPPNLAGSFTKVVWHAANFSFPLFILLLLFACADFSGAVARLGISSQPTFQQGKLDTVLSLAYEDRNPNRLLETAGDPTIARITPTPYWFQFALSKTRWETNEEADYPWEVDKEGFQEVWYENLLMWQKASSFMTAVENIAVGESALSNHSVSRGNGTALGYNALERESLEWQGQPVHQAYGLKIGAKPLAWIPQSIPLDCSAESMLTYWQLAGLKLTQESVDMYREEYGIELAYTENNASVPDCSFTSRRESGIFGQLAGWENPSTVVITHHILMAHTTANYSLLYDGVETNLPNLTSVDKSLAMDREHWQEGRIVEKLDGIKFDNFVLNFSTAILASGPMYDLDNKEGTTAETWRESENWARLHFYLVVATLDTCPPPPADPLEETSSEDVSDPERSCLVYVFLQCPQFEEDFESFKNLFQDSPTQCSSSAFHLVWGHNFVADETLAAVVAGLYGIVQPNIFVDEFELRAFIRNSIPAALFALSTIKMLPSNELLIVPRINYIYFVFMALPFVLSAALLVLFKCRNMNRQGRDVPTSSYHMFLMGNEKRASTLPVPKRVGKIFPSHMNHRLVYERVTQHDECIDVVKLAEDKERWTDPFLRSAIRSLMKDGMDTVDERHEWTKQRIEGNALSAAAASVDPTHPSSTKHKWITSAVDRRLEFLTVPERKAWLGFVLDAQHVKFQSEDVSETNGTNMEVSVSAHPTTASSVSVMTDFDALEEGKAVKHKRKVIRDGPKVCSVCIYEINNGGRKKLNTCRRGCKACNVVCCEAHWDSFDHSCPEKYL